MLRHLRTYETQLFLIAQGILYVQFLYLDIFTEKSVSYAKWIKYVMVLLCFCYVLLCEDSDSDTQQEGPAMDGKVQKTCLQSAFLFTVIADYYLLILDRHYIYGVVSFIIVQQIYGIKLDISRTSKRRVQNCRIPLRLFFVRILFQVMIAVAVCCMISHMGAAMEQLLVVSVFYFVSIVWNVINAIIISLNDTGSIGSRLFADGMILFLLCDIQVGICNLLNFNIFPYSINHRVYIISSVLIWVFYIPSQVLIALSVHNNRAIYTKIW